MKRNQISHQILIFLYYVYLVDSVDFGSLGFIFSVDTGSVFSLLFLISAFSPQVEFPSLAKSIIFSFYLSFSFSLTFFLKAQFLLSLQQYAYYWWGKGENINNIGKVLGLPHTPQGFQVFCSSVFFFSSAFGRSP